MHWLVRTLTAIAFLSVLAIDAAAVHDVIVGEPDIRLELLVLVASALLLLAFLARRRQTGTST